MSEIICKDAERWDVDQPHCPCFENTAPTGCGGYYCQLRMTMVYDNEICSFASALRTVMEDSEFVLVAVPKDADYVDAYGRVAEPEYLEALGRWKVGDSK